MLTEIYVQEKLRELGWGASQSLRHARISTGTGFRLKQLIRYAGVASRRSGRLLESWASPHGPRADGMPAEPTRPTSG